MGPGDPSEQQASAGTASAAGLQGRMGPGDPSEQQASAGTASAAGPQGRMGPRQVFDMALLVLFGIAMGASEFVPIGIEPELAASFGVGLDTVGLLISWFAIAYAVFTPVLALTTGRFKRYTLLVIYGIIFVLGNLIAVIAPSFEVLLASRVVMGAVCGPSLALCITFVPELVPGKAVSMGISIVYASWSVAMVFVTSIGRLVAVMLDWHLLLVGVFVLACVAVVLAVVFLPRAGACDEPATVRDQLPLLVRPRVVTGVLVFVFGIGGVYVFYSYITPYLEDVLGTSAELASVVLMAYGIMSIVSNLSAGIIDMRWGVAGLVFVFAVQTSALFGLWAVCGNTIVGIALVMLVALAMYSFATPLVSMFLFQARRYCPKALTLSTSLDPMAFNTGIAFGTYVGGAVVAGLGISWVGIVGAALSAVALCLVLANLALGRHEAAVPKD